MEIQRTKNIKTKNIYFDQEDDYLDNQFYLNHEKRPEAYKGGPSQPGYIPSSQAEAEYIAKETAKGNDPMRNITGANTSAEPSATNSSAPKMSGIKQWERAKELERAALEVPKGPTRDKAVSAAQEAIKDAQRTMVNEHYEANRSALESQTRAQVSKASEAEIEAGIAKNDVRRAGLEGTPYGDAAMEVADKQIAEERAARGRAAEQTYRQREGILAQERDKRLEEIDNEDIVSIQDVEKEETVNLAEFTKKAVENNPQLIAKKLETGENAYHPASGEGSTTTPGPGGSSGETAGGISSETTDETITFNIETVEDAKGEIKTFINSLGDILEEFQTKFGPYAELNEELYTEELATSISNIINDFSTQFKTLSEDADAYANWLGTTVSEVTSTMQESSDIVGETQPNPIPHHSGGHYTE